MSDPTFLTLNDGRPMPQLGLGVWRTPPDETGAVVEAALKAGYRAIDGAAIYGNEQGLGEGLRRAGLPRDEVFVTTKLWNSQQGYDTTIAALGESLDRLGLDHVDLYLIHWPAPAKGLFVDSWKALVKLREEGRARSIGVSNFNAEHLKAIVDATGVTPAVNQIELHPDFQQRELRAEHGRLGITTESWSPLGQGGDLLRNDVLKTVAGKHGKTPAQVVVRWHIDSSLLVIPKSAHEARLRENLDVFDFTLDADDMAAIEALDDPNARLGPDPLSANF